MTKTVFNVSRSDFLAHLRKHKGWHCYSTFDDNAVHVLYYLGRVVIAEMSVIYEKKNKRDRGPLDNNRICRTLHWYPIVPDYVRSAELAYV